MTATVRLGTVVAPSRPMLRSEASANRAGATKTPSARLIAGSRRKRATSRGVYWLAPNWTTTTAIETTRPVKAIIPLAIEERIVRAVSASRPRPSRSRSPSIRGTSSPSASAATMYRLGMKTRLPASVSRSRNRRRQLRERSGADSCSCSGAAPSALASVTAAPSPPHRASLPDRPDGAAGAGARAVCRRRAQAAAGAGAGSAAAGPGVAAEKAIPSSRSEPRRIITMSRA